MPARERLIEADAVQRLRARDVTLFSDDPAVQSAVANRLGWTDLAQQASALLPEIERIARTARDERVTDVALLGMGGSSLASLVMAQVLRPEAAQLHVFDTVSPVTVGEALEALDPARTLFVVASKSGGTIEPNTLYAVFRERADEVLGAEKAGDRFIAVTDPGSSLATLAAEAGFRATVTAPPSVGGRFSALTAFGLVPAALIGADLTTLLQRGESGEEACASSYEQNPAVELATFMVDAAENGADKLSLVSSPRLRSFGLWVEQLVAESLGKHGKGVVPVVELSDLPRGYGADRAVVVVRMTGDERLAQWAQSQRGQHPVYEIVFDDAYDVAEEFVRWEHAVALAGHLLGINPFDEPNVAEAKAATEKVLAGDAQLPTPHGSADGIDILFAGGLAAPDHHEHSAATAVGHLIASLREGDYLAVLAYLPDDDALLAPLTSVVPAISAQTGAAVCLELGPRYLHSTGQLHKGGPNNGAFVLLTTRDGRDVAVPGQEWGLAELHRSQAIGDLLTLAAHDRRVLHLDLTDASPDYIGRVAAALGDGAGVIRQASARERLEGL